jgi:hypothetical protein
VSLRLRPLQLLHLQLLQISLHGMSDIGDEVAEILRGEQLDKIEAAAVLERKPGKITQKQTRALQRYLRQCAARGDDAIAAELPAVNMNTTLGMRYKAIASAIILDMGGVDRCSQVALQLIRRFAGASALAEQLEVRAVGGEQIKTEEHAMLSSTLTRIARLIGTGRHARDVTPTLGDLLRQFNEEEGRDGGTQEESEDAAD